MKLPRIVLAVLLIIVFAFMCMRCVTPIKSGNGIESSLSHSSSNTVYSDYTVIEIDNCEYIIAQGGSVASIAIIHKANCKNHSVAN